MKLILPLEVMLPRKRIDDRKFILNLNTYRNTHHMILNPAKVLYKDQVAYAYALAGGRELPPAPYRFTYTVFPSSRRAFDLGNVCSIIDKFTADALQELGVIENDNYNHIPEMVFKFGQVDKTHPRCELVIEPIAEAKHGGA